MTNQNSPVRQSMREEIIEILKGMYVVTSPYVMKDIDEATDKLLTYFTQLLNEILPGIEKINTPYETLNMFNGGSNSCRSQILANYEKRLRLESDEGIGEGK